MAGLASGVELAEGENLVMEIEAELWATGSSPIARFIGGIKKFIAMIFGFRKRGFLIITDKRVVEVSEQIGYWCVVTGRQVKNVMPNSVKEIGCVKAAMCGCFCHAHYLYYVGATQRTSIQMKGADESAVFKAAEAFYAVICAAEADGQTEGLTDNRPADRTDTAELPRRPEALLAVGGAADSPRTAAKKQYAAAAHHRRGAGFGFDRGGGRGLDRARFKHREVFGEKNNNGVRFFARSSSNA